MTPEALAAARWFRSKNRAIVSVTEVDRVTLRPGALVVHEVRFADDGPAERYLVPEVSGREPADGEGMWQAIAAAMTVGDRVGRFSFKPVADGVPVPGGERRLRVEQSNTSVVIGDRLILKLYRLLEPGVNPDLEVAAFLTRAGFRDTPAVHGAVHWETPEGATADAAMLQDFVTTTGDGWRAMLDALGADPSEGVSMAGRIGRVTGRMHLALASRPDEPGFPVRTADHADVAGWRASAEGQLEAAMAVVGGKARDRLAELAPAVRARFADAFGAALGTSVSRVHGDYHLGQLLARPDGAFSVIDFEGEPARPMSERRLPSSPLRDVAGMLRSLDYAARTAEAGAHAPGFDADDWLTRARAAFLGSHGAIDTDQTPQLDAFELEKACYEIRYETNNRPDWIWLPLAAVERLAQQ